jgi:endonuclease YncB( thermonuclease family)
MAYCKAGFPTHGERTATVREAVHDGDTVHIAISGDFGIRFLGIDTPEVSFQLPNTRKFVPIRKFAEYLTDPFSNDYADSMELAASLGDNLVNNLRSRLGPDCAKNHEYHAQRAHRHLEKLIQQDVDEREVQGREFRFFLAFAHDVMDGYGRFLCYLHRDDTPDERKNRMSYNERMLEYGMACPYFIWPNINPFRKQSNLQKAVPAPGQLRNWIDDLAFARARQFVKDARNNKAGIFEQGNPLALLPFELRYLSTRHPPYRYILDLSKDEPLLLNPMDYYTIPNMEDRLFIDSHFVPLFLDKEYHIV